MMSKNKTDNNFAVYYPSLAGEQFLERNKKYIFKLFSKFFSKKKATNNY